jgi:hypothetical protein
MIVVIGLNFPLLFIFRNDSVAFEGFDKRPFDVQIATFGITDVESICRSIRIVDKPLTDYEIRRTAPNEIRPTNLRTGEIVSGKISHFPLRSYEIKLYNGIGRGDVI